MKCKSRHLIRAASFVLLAVSIAIPQNGTTPGALSAPYPTAARFACRAVR